MNKKLILLAFLTVFCSSVSAQGQTAADIRAKYGNSIEVYSVGEHIWMTPEYASDGQVCRIRLYPKRVGENTSYGSHELPFSELRDVLNSLVPVSMRGTKKESFGATATGGGAAWTNYDYENVSLTFVSFFSSRTFDGSVLKKGEYVFPSQPKDSLRKNSNPSAEDFIDAASARTEIVTIRWVGRKCVTQ